MDKKFSFLKGKIISSRVYPEFFPFKLADRVINIGCGLGPQAIVYADQYKEMVGVDINRQRLDRSEQVIKTYNLKNYQTICANVEEIPLARNSFDKAIAVDIIEHIQNPSNLCLEAQRLLKEDGQLMITFPAMHDKFTSFASQVGRLLGRKKKKRTDAGWNPDSHNQKHPLKEWITIVENCGFELVKSRASTLFPPLHLYGVPRFWFSNNLVHKIDSFFCKMPILKNLGQSLICVFIAKRRGHD